jgi:HK97 family phage prohead protease
MTENEDRSRPTVGEVESRTAAIEVADKRIRGLIPYGIESRDLGGWTEIIEPTAFRNAKLDELRAVIDHQGVPLGRYPDTLDVEDADDGLRWSLDPPKSRQDVIEAIQRGDMRAGSWRMLVGRDEWRGDTRHVHEIAELRDVTIVGAEEPAYGEAARVEYRTQNNGDEHRQEGAEMATEDGAAVEQRENGNSGETATAATSTGTTTSNVTVSMPTTTSTTGLRVEERTSPARRGLADEFRAAGFPGDVAEIPWSVYEDRAVTWTPSINLLNQVDREGVPLGFDQRYVWTTLPRIGVDSGVTSVLVLQQTARSLATAANVVRAIDATSNKPETGSTINLITVPLSQVANVQSGIPNVVLEQDGINTIIENDLTLAVNEGLDKIVNDTLGASGFQPPGSDNLVASVRKAMTTLLGAGYAPDTLVLTPAAAEGLDLLTSGISGGTADYVFQPGQPAPGIWGLRRVISKVVAAPVVLDSSAYGKLYASPARLAKFEENSGKSNTSLVRLELHAACGVERQAAAVRIAAS